jgi:hypothetical protein
MAMYLKCPKQSVKLNLFEGFLLSTNIQSWTACKEYSKPEKVHDTKKWMEYWKVSSCFTGPKRADFNRQNFFKSLVAENNFAPTLSDFRRLILSTYEYG